MLISPGVDLLFPPPPPPKKKKKRWKKTPSPPPFKPGGFQSLDEVHKILGMPHARKVAPWRFRGPNRILQDPQDPNQWEGPWTNLYDAGVGIGPQNDATFENPMILRVEILFRL